MTNTSTLSAADLRRAMVVYHRVLGEHRERLNALNVYPVPDADTGANLCSTLGAVVDALPADNPDGMPVVCHAITRGALLGARGASGVITSQLLGAFSRAVVGLSEVGGEDLGRALDEAKEAAYSAVLRPTEGTILTVLREAAEAAKEAAADPSRSSVLGVLESARAAASAALDATTEMLPALKAAGVVDAGGAGLLLLFDALLHVADGRPLPSAPVPSRPAPQPPIPGEVPRYEVVVRLTAPPDVMHQFRAVWDELGNESTVVVEGAGDWVCHIHTDFPEAAMEAARAAGEIHDVLVTDLIEQLTELSTGTTADQVAVVAVAPGAGAQEHFRERGATGVVAGGPSTNPSTAELLRAVEATSAPIVVLLPNDSNVIPAARQVIDLASARVIVIPTDSVPAGLASLRHFDPGAPDGGVAEMEVAAAAVAAGGVTRAVRAADSPVGRIEEGDWLARSTDGQISVADTPLEAARSLLGRLVDSREPERVTVLTGDGSAPAVVEAIRQEVAGRWPESEFLVIDGGQPHYAYLIGVEAE